MLRQVENAEGSKKSCYSSPLRYHNYGARWKWVPAGEPRRGARWQPRRRCLGSSLDGEVDPQVMQPAGSLQE